jgi:hypothetical protein
LPRHAQCLTQVINAKRSKPEVVTPLLGLAEEILEYLQAHPNASDTLSGITEWWVLKQRIEAAANDVQKALDQLIALGFVLKTGTHGVASYQFNRGRLEQIRLLQAKRKKNQPNKPNPFRTRRQISATVVRMASGFGITGSSANEKEINEPAASISTLSQTEDSYLSAHSKNAASFMRNWTCKR